jgi:signal transduction histidine kinase
MMRKVSRSQSDVDSCYGPLPAITRHFRAARRSCEPHHEATDTPVEAQPEELDAIRNQLGTIETMLAQLFGPAYDRGDVNMAARADAARIVERDFAQIVEEWCVSVEKTITHDWNPPRETHQVNRSGMANALVRFVAHLRDPADLRTYIHLRHHCQEGMLARSKPSEFNVFHIALKQVILDHIRTNLKGRRMELVRDTIVAAIDERRLMVAQFYIESRERALKASEEKYRNSIDHAPDPMYEIEPGSLIILGANAAAFELHHLLPEEREKELIGARLAELSPPEMQPGVLQHVEQVIAVGSDRVLDLPISGRFFDVHSALISSGNRQFIQMILRDVTQRHEMLDELVKAERLAAAGTFASGVAHEVNNPLASISSLVQSLLPGEADAERALMLTTILSQITRIATTVKDLVNFGRPAPVERRALDLNDMIRETLRLVTYNRRFDGVVIEPALATDLTPTYADHNGIQQVILNILFNAADALQHQGGTIHVTTANQRGPSGEARVKMKIADSGCGIPAENLERVFDPFFTTKPAGAGVGMGLSLCQSIVLTNHGTIKVESREGSGTAVTICLPTVTDGPPAVAASLQ